MARPPPPVQNEKTVSNIEFSWYSVVIAADPDLERERHRELFYDFGASGHRARNFYGDPTKSGAYARPADFSRPDFMPGDFLTDP